jgi:hypothetical protein
MPEIRPTGAIDVLLLVHAPPLLALYKLVVAPRHTAGVPVMVAGIGFIVTLLEVWQPTGDV